MKNHHERLPATACDTPSIGELTSGVSRLSVRGQALQLILWISRHQSRINQTAPDSGQLILNWKGDGSLSIAGEIKTRL